MREKFENFKALKYLLFISIGLILMSILSQIPVQAAAPDSAEILYKPDMTPDAPSDYIAYNNIKFCEMTKNQGATIVDQYGMPFMIATNNTIDNYTVEYTLDLTNLHDARNKGDLKAQAAFNVFNYWRSTCLREDDVAVFSLLYETSAGVRINIESIDGDTDTRIKGAGLFCDIETGWMDIPASAAKLILKFTTRRGEDNDNKAYFQNIRLYINDSAGPKALNICTPPGWPAGYNMYYREGDAVNFQVQFDECIEIEGDPKDLQLSAPKAHNPDESADFTAICLGIDPLKPRQIKYTMTVPAGVEVYNLHILEEELSTSGAFSNVKDLAGNAYSGALISNGGFDHAFLSRIKLDSLVPFLERVEITRAKPNKAYQSIGDILYFNLYFSEDLDIASYLPSFTLRLNNSVEITGDPDWPDPQNKKRMRFTYEIQAGQDSSRIDVKTAQQPDGTWNLSLYGFVVKDFAGNEANPVKAPVIGVIEGTGYVCSQQILVDTTPPNINSTSGNGWERIHALSPAVSDSGGSGVLDYTFRFTFNEPFKARILPTENPGDPPFEEINSGPAGLPHTLEIQTPHTGSYNMAMKARDNAGNTKTIIKTLNFDNTAPLISISKVTADSVRITARDSAAGLKPEDIKYQWGRYDDNTDSWVTDESLWENSTGSSTVDEYTSADITMPTTDGEINYGKLIVNARDILGNEVTAEGPAIYIDKRDAYFELELPEDASEIRPSFDITVTASSSPATDVYVQWTKSGDSTTDGNYILLGNLPSENLGSYNVQKYFNQNNSFNGRWILHVRAKRSDGTGGWIYLEEPISFRFDNSAPTVTITPIPHVQAHEAPEAEVTVTDSVYNNILGTYINNPIVLDDPESRYWVCNGAGTEVLSIPSLPGERFTADLGELKENGTGRYKLIVTAMGQDGIVPSQGSSNYTNDYIYLDVDAPMDGHVINMPQYINSAEFSGVKFICTDVTTSFDSMYFNYAVDDVWVYDLEDTSSWTVYNFTDPSSNNNRTGLEADPLACKYKYEYESDSVTIEVPDMEGDHTLSWMFMDNSGNLSKIDSQKFILDKTPPTGGLTFDCMTLTNQNTDARVAWVLDVYSAYDNIEVYQESENTWVVPDQWSKTIKQNGTYTCMIRDEAGNESEITGQIDWIDKRKPDITTTVNLTYPTYEKFSFDVEAWDINREGTGRDPVKLFYSFDQYAEDQSWHEITECDTPSVKITKATTINGDDKWTVYCSFPYTGSLSGSSHTRWINLKAVDSSGNERTVQAERQNYMNVKAQVHSLGYTPPKTEGTTVGPVKAGIRFYQNVIAALGDSINIPTTFDEFPDDLLDDGSAYEFYIYENGSYDLTYQDRFGNTTTLYDYIVVDWIDDSMLPEVSTDPQGKTNGSVEVTLDATARNGVYVYNVSPPEDSSITSTEGDISFAINGTSFTGHKKVTCLAASNGKLNYSLYRTDDDKKADTYITINSIDTQAPAGTIVYAPDGIIEADGSTRGNMIATVVNMEDDSGASNIRFANSEGSTHTFTRNGSYDFILEDEAGNRTVLTAAVSNINRSPLPSDTTAPGFNLRYFVNMPGGSIDIGNTDGSLNITNRDVHVIITPADESSVTAVTIDNPTGMVVCDDDAFEYIFTGESSIKVRLTDTSPNANYTDVDIVIDNIDKVPPTGTITYQKDESTQNVTVVLDASDDRTSQLIYLNTNGMDYTPEGKPGHLFTENGSYTFIIADDAGNITNVPTAVRWIDRDKPVLKMNPSDPSTLSKTNKDVNIFITPSEPYSSVDFVGVKPDYVELVRGIDKIKLTFIKNASLALRVYDNNGNYDDIGITVNCIDKIPPTAAAGITYDQPSKGYATVSLTGQSETVDIENNGGSPEMIVKQNGRVEFVICDTAGNRATVLADVTGIDNEPPVLSLQYIPEGWTKGPVAVSLTANEDIIADDKGKQQTVSAGDSYDVVINRNGAYTLFASDMSGNTSSITAVIDKIDSIAPVLSFGDPLKPVFLENGDYDLTDCTAEDNIDGTIDPSSIAINYNGFDIGSPGSYIVEYSVSDNVGNETAVQRQVTVLSENDFRVYINNTDTLQGAIMCGTSHITLDLFNVRGVINCKWKKGSLTEGEMKNGANTVNGTSFTVNATGWHTLLVQDQERRTRLMHFYVTRL